MSQEHKGSRLLLKGQMIAVDFSSAYFNYDYDATGIQNGDLILPSANSVYTLRAKEGRYGGGVAVEEATNNLIASGGVDAFCTSTTGWSYDATKGTFSIVDDPTSLYGGKVMKYVDTDGNTSGNTWDGVTSLNINGLVSGGQYTFKVRYKVEGWTTGSVAVFSHWIPDVGADYSLPSNTYNTGKWHEFTSTVTNTAGSTGRYFKPGLNLTNSGCTIYVDAIQFEQLPFSTTFVNGNRAKGLLRYSDYNLDHTQGTLSFWYIPDIAWDDATTDSGLGGTEGKFENLLNWNLVGSPQLSLRRERVGSKILFLYNSASLYANHTLTGFVPAMLTFSWTNGQQKIYINGVLSATGTASAMTRPTSGYFDVGGRNDATYSTCNGIIDDLRIDRTVASDEEVLAWYISGVPFYNPYDKRSYAY